MRISSQIGRFLLFLGDVIVLFLSLWITLLIGYKGVPGVTVWLPHVEAFGILIAVWLVVFYISGMYEKQTITIRRLAPRMILNTQIVNSIISVLFFYFIPYFGITPKTNLFIYLLVSLALLLLWRVYGYGFFDTKKRREAVLVASSGEAHDLYQEVNGNPRYDIVFADMIDLDAVNVKTLEDRLAPYISGGKVIVLEMSHPLAQSILPRVYESVFSGVSCIDISAVYEDVFDRIPASSLTHEWFVQYASLKKAGYDAVKRLMDIGMAFVLGVISLVFYPFVFIAILLDDHGPFFISQGRIGQGGRLICVHKFRTMAADDGGDEERQRGNHVTRVGSFLRKTRIDELPQLWNVLTGDMSMIGPRPELPPYVVLYEKEIPYYRVRHLIKPGLSGWAQMYHKNPPKGSVDTNETANKLSYDLYYIKHRSLWLDIQIALKTLKIFASRSGR